MMRAVAVLVSGLCVLAADARAQTAEGLYDAGAYRLAADSFAARARGEPGIPAHWHNLGNALYRLGEDAGARAAWVRSARLAPRNTATRQALNLLPAPDAASAEATRIPYVTPGEVLTFAAVLWVLGWVLLALKRPRRFVVPVILVAAIVGILGYDKTREYARPVALIRQGNTSLRAAPFVSAQARRAMNQGTTVEVLETYAGWVLVRRGNDRGWVQQTDIVAVTG